MLPEVDSLPTQLPWVKRRIKEIQSDIEKEHEEKEDYQRQENLKKLAAELHEMKALLQIIEGVLFLDQLVKDEGRLIVP
jgi:hypothetical protein